MLQSYMRWRIEFMVIVKLWTHAHADKSIQCQMHVGSLHTASRLYPSSDWVTELHSGAFTRSLFYGFWLSCSWMLLLLARRKQIPRIKIMCCWWHHHIKMLVAHRLHLQHHLLESYSFTKGRDSVFSVVISIYRVWVCVGVCVCTH